MKMDTRYKLIILSKKLYKEIEISPDTTRLVIGTDAESNVRLRKELFFENIELTLTKVNNVWNISCLENLYFSTGDVRKLINKVLNHGDEFTVKYQNSDNEVFKISFMIDFDYEKKDYDQEIEISEYSLLKIGGKADCDIHIDNEYLGSDFITLRQNSGKWVITDENTRYGTYVNGIKINKAQELKDFDFFAIVGYSFYIKYGKLYTSKNIKIDKLPNRLTYLHSTHFEYPKFNRNTRIQYEIPEEEIEIKQPSPKPQKPKKNLIVTLIPSIVMLVLMVVLRGFMGGGGMFVIYSVGSMGIGIVMSIVTYRMDGAEFKKEVAKREKDYREYIEKKEEKIALARENELRIRNIIYSSLDNSIKEVFEYDKRIYERNNADKDFLNIYLGKGTVQAEILVKYTKQEFVDTEDEITMLPEQLEEKYRYIKNAPIVSKFNNACGIGVVGNRDKLQEMLKNFTLDLAVRHFYNEVKMYYIFDEKELEDVKWVRWLKHVHNDDIDVRNIMYDEESKKVLLENLYSILSLREAEKNASDRASFNKFYIVFVSDSQEILKHPISKYIEECEKYGFIFIFFEEYEEMLPRGCKEIIRLDNNESTGIVVSSENGDKKTIFEYEKYSNELAEKVALKLGAITVDEVSLESELTKNITLFDLLDILTVDDLDLEKRWGQSQVYRSMSAPLGVKTKNEVVSLDISDKANAHGPHGLVAGTTGSGKSEILQTYVLSMATKFHPYDVGFVIIDFKGGGMANQFKDLPHMMGAITNIDGREINRSLLSIKAELIKRQAYFAEAEVNHINDYIKLYKDGRVTEPLPHLIIIVDEFAELKAEYPDFMKELISAARIGRTLGVHLILATQKPAGVVDAQIWSNSKFKLCLKVQTKEDSNEVIKSPLAAEIVEPGRAYFQVGNNEIFELFQSAYSGAKVAVEGESTINTFDIYQLNYWGKKSLVYTNKKKNEDDKTQNELESIVDYIKAYCIGSKIHQLKGICLPPLEDVIYKDSLAGFEKPDNQNIAIPVGIFDDPEKQEQDKYVINLSENNTYIIGSSMTGKTTLLQTILIQIMENYTPQEMNAYIIDCGNMALKNFENSNFIGGVALTSEEELVTNLFKMLLNIIEERKKIFSAKGLGTHKAYKEAGYTDLPHTVLIIDNIAAFREYYDFDDKILLLSREGQSVGITLIITASQANALNYKAVSNFSTKIALNCNDSGEYMNIFDRCRITPKEVVGRGLCVIDKRILEFQTALCVEGEKEIDRVSYLNSYIEMNNRNFVYSAKPIPTVPDIINSSELKNTNPELYKTAYNIPIGIDYDSVSYKCLDILSMGMLSVLGREKSGKTNFIFNILDTINENIFTHLTEAYIIDSDEMQLEAADKYGFVAEYTVEASEAERIVDNIIEEFDARQKMLIENRGTDPQEVLKDVPLLMLVIENRQVIENVADKQLSQKILSVIKQCKKLKAFVLVSNVEDLNVGYNAGELIKKVKDNKKAVYFDDLANSKLLDVSVKQLKENSKPITLGDAYIFASGNISKIKTIYCEKEVSNG